MVEMNLGEKNKVIYPGKDIYIDKSELYLFHKYEDELKNAKILDIGIGFGRTTYYFANICKEYIGVDYQQVPVDFCKQNFKQLQNANFYVCDARNMNIFEDNYFDIVFFSFNGIDYVSHTDRTLVLEEMKRVCNPNGIIYFSSHNLQGFKDFINEEREFSFRFFTDPCKFIRFLKNRLFLIRLKRKNPRLNNIINNSSTLEYAIISYAQNFKLTLHFVSPDKQIEQLKKMGLKDIRIISTNNGMEVKQADEIKSLRDFAVYYFCRTEAQGEDK